MKYVSFYVEIRDCNVLSVISIISIYYMCVLNLDIRNTYCMLYKDIYTMYLSHQIIYRYLLYLGIKYYSTSRRLQMKKNNTVNDVNYSLFQVKSIKMNFFTRTLLFDTYHDKLCCFHLLVKSSNCVSRDSSGTEG